MMKALLFLILNLFVVEPHAPFLLKKCDKSYSTCYYYNPNNKKKIKDERITEIYTDTFYNYAIVSIKNEGFVLIDRNFKIKYHVMKFDNGPDEVSTGYFRIIEKGKYGFANMDGKAIEPKYDFVQPFSSGIAAVCVGCKFVKNGEYTSIVDGKWGAINLDGELVIPLNYERVINQYNGEFIEFELNQQIVKITEKEFYSK